uniref:Membrane protein of ER body-like protein n=1 Tax=Cajanus cajan TaxID=3821 RepID=A0A151U0F5_CAJCA|nr:hypothetical protein KK1_005356 [Cajanus cajan]
MEQEGHQWTHEEEEEEEMMEGGALIRKQSVSHSKGSLLTNEVTFSSSSSSSSSNESEHSNGVFSVVTAPDGSLVQKEEEIAEIGDGGEDSNHVNGDKVDYEAVGLAQVAEFAGVATNGEVISGVAVSQNKNSVYFDEQQGMWKCHHCTWTKRFDSPWTVPNWNLKGYHDLMMNVKTMIQHGPCFYCETKDDEVNGPNGVQNGDAFGSVHPTNLGEREIDVQTDQSVIQNSLCSEVTDKCMKTVDNKLPSIPELSNIHNSSDIQATAVTNFHKETSTKDAPNLIKEIDQQLEEFDVEAVLAKQETHDLYCPNCHSCITKRVILKKRKRYLQKSDTKAKRDKLEIIGKCFELFRNFGGANKNEGAQTPSIAPSSNLQNPSNLPASNVQNPSNPQGSNANWLRSLFTLKRGKKASDASLDYSRTGSAEQHNSAPITSDELTSPEIAHPKGPLADSSVSKNVKTTPDINRDHEGMNSVISSTNLSPIQSCTKGAGDLMNGVQKVEQDFIDFSTMEQLLHGKPMINEGEKKNASADITKTVATTTEMNVKAEETAKDTILKPYEGELEFPVSTTVGSLVLEESLQDVDNKQKIVENNYSSSVQGVTSPIQSSGSAILANDIASIKQNSGIYAILPSKPDFAHVQKDIGKELDSSTGKQNAGGEVIVDVERESFKSTTALTADNMPPEGAIITGSHTLVQVDERPSEEVGEPQGWEILKSIVYGGLAESITSLGIVSSAVSSGATPLNIIALGFANIIGGLFILGHNLIDLKNDHTGGDQVQTNVQDRYQELLGRRANFLLHAVVAVLSFLIFGAVPLVIYGVLINKNYYTEVKLASVAASSIVCIILLAIGKVYTSSPPKSYIKTVSYYVTLALAASGVSYIGGNLIKDLLEKLNHQESGFAITMPLSDTSKSAWMSY